ncbi:hypothetical protein CDIK_2893 [Cucumispora dikerogammari]|nr:hypothetical protein CDIK_2893 [Cucumispora dikerogammari]
MYRQISQSLNIYNYNTLNLLSKFIKPSTESEIASKTNTLCSVYKDTIVTDFTEIVFDLKEWLDLESYEKTENKNVCQIKILSINNLAKKVCKPVVLTGFIFSKYTFEPLSLVRIKLFRSEKTNNFFLPLNADNKMATSIIFQNQENISCKAFKLCFICPAQLQHIIHEDVIKVIEAIETETVSLIRLIEQDYDEECFEDTDSCYKIHYEAVTAARDLKNTSPQLKTRLISYLDLVKIFFEVKKIKKVSFEKLNVFKSNKNIKPEPFEQIKTQHHKKINAITTQIFKETTSLLEEADKELIYEIKSFVKDKLKEKIKELNLSNVIRYKIFQFFKKEIEICSKENPFLLAKIIEDMKQKIDEASKFVIFETPFLILEP